MKRFFAIFISAFLLFCLVACGQTPQQETKDEAIPGNTIAEYMNKDYTSTGVTIEDNILTMFFIAPDRSDYIQVSVPLTSEEYDAYNELDFFAEDYDQQENDFLSALSGEITVTELNDQVPSEEELSQFVGMTLTELEAAGYEQTSMDTGDDDTIVFIYSNEKIDIMVYPEGEYEDLFSLADVDLKTLVIARVQFYGFH